MPGVIFWNIQRKVLDGLIVSLVGAESPDLLILIEYPSGSFLPALLASDGYTRVSGNQRFGLFIRNSVALSREPGADRFDRADFWRMTPIGGEDWLIGVVHGHDRRNAGDGTRRVLFKRIADFMTESESRAGHRRTIVCGDLNADPFDPSVLDAAGLHAIGVRRVSGESTRSVRELGRVDYFYNPMWRLYGSDPAGDAAAATHYFADRQQVEPFWHMLDQVVIRPETADRFDESRLRILRAAGTIPLIKPDGRPDDRLASDHLPVAFTLTYGGGI